MMTDDLQICWVPVAIGDSMAEIVGSIFGTHFFSVPGIGDINKKTWEGN